MYINSVCVPGVFFIPRRGVWNAPFINSAMLVQGSWLRKLLQRQQVPQFYSDSFEPDMTFCEWMRKNVSGTDRNNDVILNAVIAVTILGNDNTRLRIVTPMLLS